VKAIDQALARGRGWWQVLRATAGRPAGWGHLVLRLDGFDAPGGAASGRALTLEEWRAHVLDLLEIGGVVPVRIVATADHPLLPDVARFCARLECPVTVRTGGLGLGDRVAEALVDAGVRRVLLVGGDVGAVGALARARADRGARLDVVAEVPVGTSLEVEGAALRAAGADGIRVGLPWQGGPWSAATVAWLDAAAAHLASFHRSDPSVLRAAGAFDGNGPGTPRTEGHCGVGGTRLELGPDGQVRCCPFQPGAVALPRTDLAEALRPHREAIRACTRRCLHAELLAPDAR